ncbi:MAG TPA: cation transporter [Spirochaetota bacterium]|mgnify:CR=1 FL=1|nr:cation transporter [Spirochaetota bacterium]HPD05383.1 cation transporter [Spirochaetota bacterium]HQG43214.1 cation transporter [Spirochaetota bacterium]HRR61573.1 cation transporter [Spirochaetota bacterium]HRV15833.1 cation transporter [Spirochaetota bacterium]
MEQLYKKALNLSLFTIAYNIIEGIVSVVAGALAGSVALVGFGLDSFVESLSGFIMIWRFKKHGKVTEQEEEVIENKALRYVGYTFIILSFYIAYESISKLYYKEIPSPSFIGIIIAVASIVVMPVLYYKKIKTAKAINSKSLSSDAKETLACTFLSLALLIGLGLNYLKGWWQADPVVGLVVTIYLIKEGIEILSGEEED